MSNIIIIIISSSSSRESARNNTITQPGWSVYIDMFMTVCCVDSVVLHSVTCR